MLEVSGALLLCVDGQDIAVCASGTDIVAEVRHPRKLLGQAGSLGRARRILRTIANRLDEHGLTLTISRRGTAVMMIGANIRTTRIGRLFGIEHAALTHREGTRRHDRSV